MAVVNLLITSNLQSFNTERRFPVNLEIRELKNKLELLTGAPAESMRLELRDKSNQFVKQLVDLNATLSHCSVEDGMIIHVTDTSGQGTSLNGSECIPKFELSSDEYAKREESLRAWKLKNKLGEFDSLSAARKEEKDQQIIQESEKLVQHISVNQRCSVATSGQNRLGTVMFVGKAHFKPGYWVGVRLDEPFGKNDGSVDAKRYFECPDKYGLFIRPQHVTIGDFPEETFDDMQEI